MVPLKEIVYKVIVRNNTTLNILTKNFLFFVRNNQRIHIQFIFIYLSKHLIIMRPSSILSKIHIKTPKPEFQLFQFPKLSEISYKELPNNGFGIHYIFLKLNLIIGQFISRFKILKSLLKSKE